jgi:hypothetical protein
VNKSDKLRVHETFSAADGSTATGVVPDVSIASEEVGALLQEVELQSSWREDPAPPTPESAPESRSFWPWFNGLTKYKRGSYSDAAARIRAYRAAQVKVVLDDAVVEQ